ncbi:MAG: nuclear transport factor 2 family protein [Lacrimispora saccharolytica]
MEIQEFWKAVLDQNEQEIRKYFHEDAYINWHCTNEHFTVDEFIVANCEYPGNWTGKIERIEKADGLLITVTHVYPIEKTSSFHVTSFIKIRDNKIASVDEYWADDGSV